MSWQPIVLLALLAVAALLVGLILIDRWRDERRYMRTIGYPKGRVERPTSPDTGDET